MMRLRPVLRYGDPMAEPVATLALFVLYAEMAPTHVRGTVYLIKKVISQAASISRRDC